MILNTGKRLLILVLALPLAASGLERAQLLPADTQASVRVSNTASFWARFKDSSVGKLWADQRFQDFIGNLDEDTLRSVFLGNNPDPDDKVFLDQIKMLVGEVLLAFRQESGSTPYIVAAISKEDYERSLEMDYKLREVSDRPVDLRKREFQGAQIVEFTENGGTPEESSWCQTFANNTLLVGPSSEWIERNIVRLNKDNVEEPAGNPRLKIDVALSRLIQTSMTNAPAARPGSVDPRALAAALGLANIEDYSLDVEMKPDELDADGTLRISDMNKGLFTLLDTQPTPLPTVSFIPEGITTLEVGRFNLLRLWQEIPAMARAVSPASGPQVDMLLAMLRQQTGIDIEQDLLAHLDTRYVAFTLGDDDRQTAVVAVSLKDARAFAKGLESLFAAPAMQSYVAAALDSSDFLDRRFYAIKGDDPEDTMAFAVSGDYFLYGNADALRQVIRSQSSEAAANPAFERSPLVKGLRQAVPPTAYGYSAVDWRKQMEFVVAELAKPELSAQATLQWRKIFRTLPPPDFSKLPPASHIASFFNLSYQYMEAVRGGIHQHIILKY